MNLHNLHTRLDRLTSRVPATPEGPPVPIVSLPDHGPPPRGTRFMTSEEVLREVVRVQHGEWSPPPLSAAQRREIDERFERLGGVARVEEKQRELLALEERNHVR